MHTNAQVLLDHRPTGRAHLRGVGGVHGHHLRTGTLSLVRQQVLELRQPRVLGAEGQVAVGGQKSEREVFQGNQPVGVDQMMRDLVPEVAAPIGDALVQTGNLVGGFAPAATALPAPRHAPLGDAQLGKAVAQPTRVVNRRPVAQRQQVMQAHVNAHRRTVMLRHGQVGCFEHQADIPFAQAAFEDDVLDDRPVGQWTVNLDLDLAHVLHVAQRSPAVVKTQLAAVAIAVFQAVETVAALEAWETRLLSGLQTAKERAERLIEAAEHLLHAGRVELTERAGVGVAQVAEVRPLLVVAHTLARLFVDGDALFQRGVVERAPLPQQEVERPRLRLRRIQPIAVGANHALLSFLLVNSNLIISREGKGGKRHSPPG